ncbi:glutathione transferase [Fomitopsis serialis]|uniref:glutathione transferase n=1 Tax=Fomitopsis serialis TaxID=139415 RepID=UPI002007B00B|nr:glutathione transferase [Neoantrodia serialis]KAH9925143.1 glutathione transferase [Neoantrodia serialis]
MVLKLYGSPLSTCTRRVAAVLKEKNVPYELIAVDLASGAHKSPEYLAKQPFGQVPYIVEEDGFQLFESRAIGRYIALKYAGQGNKVLPDPADLRAVAKFEQAASIELSNFDPFASQIAFEKVFKKNKGLGEADPARVASLTNQLLAKLDAYEVILSKQKYLAGDEVTIADLFHLTYGSMLSPLGVNALEDATKRPNLARWWKDITSRPSWQAVKNGA